ncbi:hypothetical protein BDR26DRAFT_874028 [Obelidium mucronatum]|nr:hypothetical protein BDR26DRAFT_874028 [Obelidium mucronatum]
MESFAALEDGGYHDSEMNSRWAITSGPLIPFLNKIKVELETERGLYKTFLDILTEYSSGGLSNMMTMVAVFGLFYHRHGLLSELCGHVLLLSDIPRSFPISKDFHFAKVKMPPKKQSLHQMETCRLKVAVNALPSFYPNGIHSIPLTSVSRLKKVTNTTKPSIPARNGSSTAMSSSSSGNSNSNSNTNRNFTLLNEANILSKPRRKGSSSSVPTSNSSIGDSVDGSDVSNVNTIPTRKTRLNSNNTTGSICSDSTVSECKSDLPSRKRKTSVVPIVSSNPATISFGDRILIPSTEATSEVQQQDVIIAAQETWIKESNTHAPSTGPSLPTTSAQTSMAPVKKVSSTSTAVGTPKKKTLKAAQTPQKPASAFEPSIQLPTTAEPNDPTFTKEGRLNAGYIMNALLNHQFAEHFRDPKKPDTSSTDRTNSPSPSSSTLSTITDTDSTTSADAATGRTESQPKTITSIPQHFNFSRMAERLKQGGYSSHLAFRRDFDGIIKYCREKNSFLQDTEPGKQRLDAEALEELEFELMATDRLEKYFMNEWTYFFPELSGKRRGRASVAAAMDSGDDQVVARKESAKKAKR